MGEQIGKHPDPPAQTYTLITDTSGSSDEFKPGAVNDLAQTIANDFHVVVEVTNTDSGVKTTILPDE